VTEPGSLSPPPPPPAAPVPPGAALPWEERARLGWLPALVETVKLLVVQPQAAFARARRRGDLGSPILFAVLLGWAGILAQSLWSIAFGSSIVDLLPPELRANPAFAFAGHTAGLLAQILLAPIFVVIFLFVGSAIVHLMLMLVGGTKSSEAGFEGTLRAMAYSTVAQLGAIVPFAGGLIAFVWSIVLETIGLADLHRTSTGKALAAVLLPLLLCCVCIFVAFGSLVAMFVGAAAGSGN
jgi:hypothetical protein